MQDPALGQGGELPPALVRERAAQAVAGLARPEERPSLLRRLLEGFDLPAGWELDESRLVTIAAYVAAAAALVLVARFLVREIEWRRARGTAGAQPTPAASVRVEELLEQARTARAAGDRLAALRLLFRALVIALSRRGDLEFRESWTNRELARYGTRDDESRARLTALVDELDPQVYGGRPIEDRELDRLEALCRGAVR